MTPPPGGDGTGSDPGEPETATAFERAQDALFEAVGLDVQSRFVELGAPRCRIHVLEAGEPSDDPPLVFVHGTDEFGAFLAPLMGALDGVRMLTFDRPGYGSSSEFVYTESNVRPTLVDVLDGLLDELDIERADLVGHSMGGHASLLFAGARPERVRRVVTVGAVPGFPGTRPPVPFRAMAVPVLGDLVRRFQRSGEAGVYDMAAVFGEGDTIRSHPALVRAIAAHVADPAVMQTGRSEFDALISVRGWRPPVRFRDAELRAVRQPTTVVWGSHDPLGRPEAVRRGVESIPDVRFETVDAGHIPFLAHAERCAALVREGREQSARSD